MQKRKTQQKRILSEIIKNAGQPLTVQEIHTRAKKKLKTIGIATIYREINRLLEAHEIETVLIPGDQLRYETAKHHHHHFKCEGCDKVFDLEGCPADLKNILPKGFKLKSHDLTFYGLCRGCT